MAMFEIEWWDHNFYAPPAIHTATKYAVSGNDGKSLLVINGSGFTYNVDGVPTGGTINSVQLVVSDGGGVLASVTNIHVTMADFGAALANILALHELLPWADSAPPSELVSAAPTLLHILNEDGTFTDIHGVGLSVGSGLPASGTVTSVDHVAANGSTILETVSGLSEDAQDVVLGISVGDSSDYLYELLQTGDNSASYTGPIVVGVDSYETYLQDGPGNDSYFYLNPAPSLGYWLASSGIVADLAAGTVVHGETDTLVGIDNIDGTEFADTIAGNANPNWLGGSGGNDLLSGLGGNDTLEGGDGADTLNGGVGADTMRGEFGNDTYYVDNAADSASEDANAGTDTVVASRSWAVGSNFEKVILSGSGDFNVAGNGLANTLKGNSGDNWINGSFGKDTLTGGAGRDSFIFNRTLGANNVDTITDYDVVRDVIRIDNAVFAGIGAAGALSAGAFNSGAAATQADDRIIYDGATGKLYFDIDGVGGQAQVHFATLSTKPTGMTAGEFIII